MTLLIVSCNYENRIIRNSGNNNQINKETNTMKLESSAFKSNELIPAKYTCDGKDISPPLLWDEIPIGTQTIALIVDDPDAPGRIFVHWLVYNIPNTTHQLTEHTPTVKTLPNGAVQGKNDFGKFGYGGPCPPSGIHRYFFKLYALDKSLDLAIGATKNQILAAMEGHILASAELIGRYKRQS
ncbi:phosphatidylethanolamine-binding protein [Nostoc linckia z18]|uniref:Phosphatidylethanolamine-binding protein n=3 Tax=Nostoc linckia TaxID=92942 RepID=A0A9Q5ZEY4_NOSLI|nr:phosphatidylethanolamine-binding protein [Nostoc linckia z1]PHJ66398.1 phosphatidylethanolamine-binding protein [Nostoc linckia z3]PHJ73167.1 phosphatidylethanolamine-binding protein [Nostoc linckia z2]PHJ81259.1 phosphatidylethanolamine-binding protein [Nostoc linckia z4]PHJ87738.1 phosphatidylethanolamine-binding protein [Nostoc linckia z6]PHJ99010.1 phosphatidylethanolamine-binding protein [Nostoc linckia z7]PHK05623.1 phosphatidylethanolamine-binding protein [Nostoc linckia z8]PHK1047